MSSKSVTIATLNTWKGEGAYTHRVQLIKEQAREIQPDIFFLQETLKTNTLGLDTSEFLANRLNLSTASQPARQKKRMVENAFVDSTSGLSVLTRGQILSNKRFELESDQADGERISQFVEIKLEGLLLLAINTHLTFLKNSDGIRLRELKQTLEAIENSQKYDLVILGGDFNCTPDSKPIAWLQTSAPIVFEEACRSMGARIHTVERKNRLDQIDYIFQLKGKKFRFESVRRVFDIWCPNRKTFPSDHFGVCTKLSM
ncbi:MAG: endonuclease/exonuclease/phosphatase family protein [Alphaproteobacteria bacterium]